jgi:hypothetical protein
LLAHLDFPVDHGKRTERAGLDAQTTEIARFLIDVEHDRTFWRRDVLSAGEHPSAFLKEMVVG